MDVVPARVALRRQQKAGTSGDDADGSPHVEALAPTASEGKAGRVPALNWEGNTLIAYNRAWQHGIHVTVSDVVGKCCRMFGHGHTLHSVLASPLKRTPLNHGDSNGTAPVRPGEHPA